MTCRPDEPPALTIVLPAFDEAARIVGMIASVQAYARARSLSYEIVVVADGTDGTRTLARREAARDPAIIVLGAARRRGKGRGVREAVALATGSIVGFVDADDKTPIDQVDLVIDRIDAGADVVIGTRAHPIARAEVAPSWHRRMGSAVFAGAVHRVVGLDDIGDTQCGFKFFRRVAARDLFARQRLDGYLFDVEILVLASRSGLRIDQVPVRWRSDRDSRSPLVAGAVRHSRDLWRIRRWWGRTGPTSLRPGAGAGGGEVRSASTIGPRR